MFRHIVAIVLSALALNVFAAVDANKATQAELETVKGIGPGLSTKILDARKGAEFKNWGDFVDRVSGIGPGNATRFSQAGLTVGGQAYVASSDTTAKPGKAKAEKTEKAGKPEKMAKKSGE